MRKLIRPQKSTPIRSVKNTKTFLWPEGIRPVKGQKVHCLLSKEDLASIKVKMILNTYIGNDIISRLSDQQINSLSVYIKEYNSLPKWLNEYK